MKYASSRFAISGNWVICHSAGLRRDCEGNYLATIANLRNPLSRYPSQQTQTVRVAFE